MTGDCKAPGCKIQPVSMQMCNKHYLRWIKNGTFESIADLSPLQRLIKKTTNLNNGCIEYTGTKTKNGKNRQHGYRGRMWPAARLAWFLTNGEIPSGLLVCHKCDYPPCVNVNHLFLGTPKENTHDASKKFRLSHGESHWSHKLTEKNVLEMRELYSTGEWTYAALGRRWGINASTSARVIKGRLWKHLINK